MASSGTLYSSFWGNNQARLKLEWSIASQNIANNTSTINWELSFDFPTAEWPTSWIYVYSAYLTIDGAQFVARSSAVQATPGYVFGSGQFTTTHNSDGTKSLPVSMNAAIYSASTNVSGSGSMPLNQIARAATGVSADDAIIGGTSVVRVTRATTSPAITYSIDYLSPLTGQYVPITAGYSSDTYTWTVPTNLLPNSTSGKITIRCQSVANGVVVGTVYSYMFASVPDAATYRPTIGTITATAAGTTPPGAGFVQGKTGINLSVTAAAGEGGATRSNVKFEISSNVKTSTVNGSTANPSLATYDVIAGYGTVTIKATVTDSRGRTASATKTITVQEYTPPSVTGQVASRCDADGTDNIQGTYFKVIIERAAITALNNTNSREMKFSYKIGSGTEQIVDFKPVSGYVVENYVSDPIPISIDSTAEIEINISDFYDTTKANLTIPVGFVLLDFDAGGKSVGIGAPAVAADDGRLDIGIDTYINGGIYVKSKPLYESGTWTPKISGLTTPTTECGLILRDCNYFRVGNMVTVSFNITMQTINGSGATLIRNLPFNDYVIGGHMATGMYWYRLNANYTMIYGNMTSNKTTTNGAAILLRGTQAAQNNSISNLNLSMLNGGGDSAGTILDGTVTYMLNNYI